MDVRQEPREVVGARVLAARKGRLALDPDRDRRRERRAAQVAAAHPRIPEPDAAQDVVHPTASAAGRLDLVGSVVVGLDQHPAQQAVEVRARRRLPRVPPQGRDGDRDLQRRGRREARPRVPRGAAAGDEVLDEDAARAGEGAREPADPELERSVVDAAHRPRRRRARQPEHVLDRLRSRLLPPRL